MNAGRIRVLAAACIASLAASSFSGDVNAQRGEQAERNQPSIAKGCLDHPSIDRTRVLNDRNIVFITADKTIYNNQLPRQCPSLRRNSLLNYGIENRRLCAGSAFQVLMRTGGVGSYTPGFICHLGNFVPITEAELEDLIAMTDEKRDRQSRRSARDSVTSTEVELPPPAEPAPAPPVE
jgi:hypothetical protein